MVGNSKAVSTQFTPPYNDPVVDSSRIVSSPWRNFFRGVYAALSPLGVEQTFALVNNQVDPANITGLSFNYFDSSQVIVEYLIQRITTSIGSVEMCESGAFHMVYKPLSRVWEMQGIRTPASGAFTAATTDICTKVNHGMLLGQKVQLFTTTTLPAGLSLGTDYWVIPQTVDTFKLATSFSNAQAGTAVDITSTGTGTHTLQPGAGVKLTTNIDGQVQYQSSNITGTAAVSKITWRARSLAAKNALYSSPGSPW